MMDLSIILLSIIVIIIIYWYFFRSQNAFAEQGIKGPISWPLIGNSIYAMKYGLIGYQFMCRKHYGKVVRIKNFDRHGLMIFDVDLLKELMIKKSCDFTDRDSPFDFPRPFDRGIASLKGEEWRRVRHAITPTFTTGKLKRMTPLVFRSVEILTNYFKSMAEENRDIDVKEIFGRFAITVLTETMFGIELDAMSNEDNPFIKNLKKFMDFGIIKLLRFILAKVPLIGLIFHVEVISPDVINYLAKVLERAIQERKGRESQFHDFLSLMLKSEVDEDEVQKSGNKVRGLTNEEIMGQSMLFMFAGYETASVALTYTAYMLALNPDAQQRCREEITAEFNDESPESLYESLSRMTYVEQCIKESMRKYPPAVLTDRIATEDTTLGDIRVPKGSYFQIPIHAIMHDPELWADPDTFNPDRFSSEDGDVNKLPFHYLIFGNGPRNCIGMRFALLEMKLALVNIVRCMRLEACENTPKEPLEFGFLGLSNPNKKIVIRARKIE